MGGSQISTTLNVPSSGQPTFIIKCGDEYYGTVSVSHYIPDNATTPELKDDVNAIIALFNENKRAGRTCEAVRLPKENNVMSMQATNRR